MKKGFTLIELVIVVIILGILAAVGIPQYMKAIEKARGAEGYAGLGYIQQGEKIYYANKEVYYPSAGAKLTAAEQKDLDISLPQTGWNFSIVASVPPAPPTFTATATRMGGQCVGNTMSIDQTGILVEAPWRPCQEGL